MAAKDYVCSGSAAVVLKDPIKYMSIETTDKDLKDAKSPEDIAKMCKDAKWVGAPDKTDELLIGWGPDVCADPPMAMMSVMPFVWYFVFYLGLWSYFIFNIWSLKEELAKGPKDDTEMGVKPAVAVATATPAVAVATATVTA